MKDNPAKNKLIDLVISGSYPGLNEVEAFFHQELSEHIHTAELTRSKLGLAFKGLLELAVKVQQSGGKILFFGNGGSAADAQHLATELTVRFNKNRVALAALSLATDTSTLTAIGNDLGFEQLFSRQLEAIGKQGDLAIAISTSGTSPNIIAGLQKSRELGIYTAALGGKDGGFMLNWVDHALIVPSNVTSRIQEMHITLGQMLCSAIERQLGLVN